MNPEGQLDSKNYAHYKTELKAHETIWKWHTFIVLYNMLLYLREQLNLESCLTTAKLQFPHL